MAVGGGLAASRKYGGGKGGGGGGGKFPKFDQTGTSNPTTSLIKKASKSWGRANRNGHTRMLTDMNEPGSDIDISSAFNSTKGTWQFYSATVSPSGDYTTTLNN